MTIFLALIQHTLQLMHKQGRIMLSIIFFFIAISLLPFGVGAEISLLKKLAPGLLWVALLLSLLLSLDSMFQEDYEDGTLDQLMLINMPLETIIIAKLCAHCLSIILPLIASVSIGGILLNITIETMPLMLMSMISAIPALACLGGIGAAIAVSIKRGALFGALITMPLYVPLIIFGSTSITSPAPWMNISILALFSLAAFMLSPFVIAASLRASLR